MAQYLDKPGLDALWTKIKGTFVAQIIKKSDSSNATQIIHNGEKVSLSRGIIYNSASQPGETTYSKKTSIDIIGDDIIFTAANRPSYKTSYSETPVQLALKSDLIIAGINDLGLVKSTTTGTTANRDYYVEVNPENGTMKVNVPWTDNNTTYSIATSSTPGLVKLVNDTVQSTAANGVTNTSSRTYAIQKNGNNQLVVNVPWTDTNTTYTFNGAVSTIKDNNLTPSKVLISNSDGKVAVSNISSTELSYLQGANENIQNRLNTLTSYFANGTALYARADEDGNNIINTYATKDELNTFKGLKGQANGLATLDSSGKVPSSQLPSYVDDVIEGYYYNSKFYKESSHTTEITGESGKIYTDLGNNKTYRWSGTTYTEISASLALGETSSTAYPGNKGAANAANIKTNTNNIKALQGYFTNDVANKAAADASGNNIADTYAKKQNLASVAENVSAKIDKSVLTAKGDIIYASAADTPTRLGIGANGKVLKVANGVPSWADDINTNTAHSHSAGVGLTGSGNAGTSGTYTYKVNLRDEHVASNSSTYTAGGSTKFYAVQLDKDNKLSVYVPWTDNNTTYTAGTGLSLSGTTFNINTNYTTNGKNYAVKTDSNKNLYVNVPWVNTTDHSHSNKTILDNFEGAISTDYINALS